MCAAISNIIIGFDPSLVMRRRIVSFLLLQKNYLIKKIHCSLVWIITVLLMLAAQCTLANPQGGTVVGGQATISSNGNRLDVNQNSHRAIIDWRSFNISQGEHTNFKQPSASSVALNRVRGGQLSQIDGRLTANGQIFLINPNGVIFGPSAQVAVGGLVTTTTDLRNEDFMAGNYHFNQPSPNPNASITNLGQITVNEGGAVVLAAPTVSNQGVIRARLGHVKLASANTFTLDFHGDGLLSFEIEGEVTQKPSSISDDGALVNNSGTIIAEGGLVTLTAQVADDVIDRAINMDGIIQAKTLAKRQGKIVLSSGDHGIVDVSGTLDVSGTENNETGGKVHVLGEMVGLFDGTKIIADGNAGGGEVLIGGNFQGKGPEPNAKRTYVADDANIQADALEKGDGGRVIVWADEITRYYGDISAKGGELGGDGGFIEVSGKENLNFNGDVNVNATLGWSGSLLLDPINILIKKFPDGAGFPGADDDKFHIDEEMDTLIAFSDVNEIPGGFLNPDYFNLIDTPFTISTKKLESLKGKIFLQATSDIDINDALDLKNLKTPIEDKLVFQAGNAININANVTTFGGDLQFEADLTPAIFLDTINVKEGVSIKTNGGEATGGNITLIAERINLQEGSEINAGSGQINIAKIENSEPLIKVAAEINAGENITSNFDVFIAANNFEQIKTSGNLILGRATPAGNYNGFVTLPPEITAPKITISTATKFNASNVILEATKDIALDALISSVDPVNNPVNLILRPSLPNSSITIGENTDAGFNINTSDLSNINDFRSVKIGHDTGSHPITIKDNNIEFNNSLILNGASIEVGSLGTDTTITGKGDAFLTFNVDNINLLGDLSLTTENGGIDMNGDISSISPNSFNLSLNAGNHSLNTGDIGPNIGNVSLEGDEVSVGNIDSNSGGDILITAADLLIEPSSDPNTKRVINSNGGRLFLRPNSPNSAVLLGDFDLDDPDFFFSNSDLASFGSGFNNIIIGRSDGKHAININNAVLDSTSPWTIRTPVAGSINLTGSLHSNGPLTLQGSGSTTFLNGNITTTGSPITINDAVILQSPVILDTTANGIGAGITFNGTLNGTDPLTLSSGIGNLIFNGDASLGNVTVSSANNINMNYRFLAGFTDLNFTGFWRNNESRPLNVGALSVSTSRAIGAEVFGTVNGRGRIFAADEVEVVTVVDPNFTINGCIMGIPCTLHNNFNSLSLPPIRDPLGFRAFDLVSIWEQKKILKDPRDERYSNLGNEELWWEKPIKSSDEKEEK